MEEPRDSFSAAVDPDSAAREYVVGRVKAGAKREAIVQELVQRGYDPYRAEELVRGLVQEHAGSARKSAIGLVVGGIVIAIIGCVLTYASYSSAASRAGGGTYYVCTGIILLGIYMAIRGTVQLIRGHE